MTLSVVIPNYNGAQLLPRYLPSILAAAERAGAVDLTLVDDASTDGSLDAARKVSADIRLVSRQANGGFGETVNQGAGLSQATHIAVLMTDLEMEPDSLAAAMQAFDSDDVFAVGLHLKNSEEGGNAGITALPFSRGFYHTAFPDVEPAGPRFGPSRVEVAFAVGGAMIVRADRFAELGMFDRDYAPFYWEDVDLCWRAWARGWRCVNEPRALAWHRHPHATVRSAADKARVDRILWRNRILFVHKNAPETYTRLQHFLWLRLMLLKAALRGDRLLADAWRDARAALARSGRRTPSPAGLTRRLAEARAVTEAPQ